MKFSVTRLEISNVAGDKQIEYLKFLLLSLFLILPQITKKNFQLVTFYGFRNNGSTSKI